MEASARKGGRRRGGRMATAGGGLCGSDADEEKRRFNDLARPGLVSLRTSGGSVPCYVRLAPNECDVSTPSRVYLNHTKSSWRENEFRGVVSTRSTRSDSALKTDIAHIIPHFLTRVRHHHRVSLNFASLPLQVATNIHVIADADASHHQPNFPSRCDVPCLR